MIRYLFLLCFYFITTATNKAQKSTTQKNVDSIAVLKQLNAFIEAFKNLDFERFETFFADDVTVFFPPSALVSYRVDGKEKVMNVFKTFFEKVKKGKSSPPYLDINPQKMKLALFQDIAIATFELDEENSLSRRTIILKKEKGKFLILHLHASRIDNQK